MNLEEIRRHRAPQPDASDKSHEEEPLTDQPIWTRPEFLRKRLLRMWHKES